MSIKAIALLNELFNYDVEIDGDNMRASVYLGSTLLYVTEIV